jgi:hypothetical protein
MNLHDKLLLSKDKTALHVNPSLTLSALPPETFQYRLGNRSALDGSSTSAGSNKTNAAASAPTRTRRTTRNTLCRWWSRWCG